MSRQRPLFILAFCLLLTACGGGSGGSSLPNVVTHDTSLLAKRASTGGVTFNDWPTYGYDNARDGFNPNSTAISPTSLSGLHLGWKTTVGSFSTQTQPIVATNVAGHSALLIVGTGGGSVNAYDGLTGKSVWTRSFGEENFKCASSSNNYVVGIGGTAAYDPASKSLYVSTNVNTVANGPTTNSIVRLDAASGTTLGSVNVTANALPGELNFAHTSLTLGTNGLVYTGTGSTCDIASSRGRVAAVATSNMSLAHTFFSAWNQGGPYAGGGVWGWGGVSIDDGGNVFASTGNAFGGGIGGIKAPFEAAPAENSGYADNFVKLSADLHLLAHNFPNFTFDSHHYDLDFTGTPTLFRPVGCNTLAAAQSKAGELVVYNTSSIHGGPIAKYQFAVSTPNGGYLGNPGYSPLTGLLYAPVSSSQGGSIEPPGMVALKPSGCYSMDIVWESSFGPDSQGFSSGPISRTAPTETAGGVVFVGTACNPTSSGGCGAPSSPAGGAVWALDASSGVVLNGGLPVLYTASVMRMAPVVDGNWMWVYDNSGNLYGLTTDPSVTAIANKREVVAPQQAAIPYQ